MKCEIIAEIGQNHNGDMAIAKELIHAAAENGADVAKFQLFDAKALFPTKEQGNEWYDYNCSTELSRDDLALLKEECDKTGIEFMSSAFDAERVGWLEAVGVKRYKIASRSIKDAAILEAVIKTRKPIIASLGLWKGDTLPKIAAHAPVHYLYCVAKYPTPLIDLHFEDIDFVNKYAGFSDHTIGLSAPVAAIARGARIIEKHFTLDKNMHGPDHQGSMTPAELKELARFRDEIAVCLGDAASAENSIVMTGTGKAFVLQS
ncbi:MAG: N-acetylneuraminate synthase family protein [Micavibrio aeruginosavorus]|uniref:N-acetylneuraminate synthase family protein n=1 Tax=Micavibrio aeruginosavorus TaxID=349221 RepID=A0A7T5UHT5_9BACT|nr:MAG: N-acetylneuraminate synthase family protein [Micavibrio aeruginosavorus]